MSDDVATLLDSARLRDLGYVLVAVLALAAFVRERRAAGPPDEAATVSPLWPTYWVVTAGVVLTMAVGRAGLADVLTDIGREQARERQWYDTRREFQAVAVGIVAIGWFIAVIAAIWRVPPRRRRYLPNVVAVATLVALGAVRMISLHQVDALLYRTDIAGIRVVALTELFVLGLTAGTILFSPSPAGRQLAASSPDDACVDG